MHVRRTQAQRRRLLALVAAAVLALVVGAAVGATRGGGDGDGGAGGPPAGTSRAGSGAGDRPRTEPEGAARRDAVPASVASLSLVQQAGQCILLRFTGTSAPEYVLRALRERRVAGVVLFGDNIDGPAQLRALSAELREAGGGRTIVATDQEGGTVRNVPGAGPETPAPAISEVAQAQAVATEAGRELRAAGITLNLAPVADLGGPVLGGRAFPGDAAQVARLVGATVRGYGRGGVLATAKHFPGLGAATANTDDAPATIAQAPDLAPFRAAVRAGVPLVMAAHARYPALDPERIASQSRPILTGLLREELGFAGVVVTDSLEAEAVVSASSTPTAAARGMRAGVDLMLTTGQGSYLPVLRRLVAEARADPAFRARVAQSAARVRALSD
jgi:beta-N-acetylhexosaminidase